MSVNTTAWYIYRSGRLRKKFSSFLLSFYSQNCFFGRHSHIFQKQDFINHLDDLMCFVIAWKLFHVQKIWSIFVSHSGRFLIFLIFRGLIETLASQSFLNRFYCKLFEFFFCCICFWDDQKKEFDEMLNIKDKIIDSKDKEIAGWKVKNDEMAQEFGQMLKVFYFTFIFSIIAIMVNLSLFLCTWKNVFYGYPRDWKKCSKDWTIKKFFCYVQKIPLHSDQALNLFGLF